MTKVSITVNGTRHEADVEPRRCSRTSCATSSG